MSDNQWLAGFQDLISNNMIIRITSDDFPHILDQYPKAIWFLHPKNPEVNLQLSPSWLRENNSINEINQLYPDLVIFESNVDEELEFLDALGFDHDMIWSKHHYRGFIISLEDYAVKRHSIGMCYCNNTFIELAVDLFPELFEPPSES